MVHSWTVNNHWSLHVVIFSDEFCVSIGKCDQRVFAGRETKERYSPWYTLFDNSTSRQSVMFWCYTGFGRLWPALCAGLLCCNFFDMLTPVPFYHFFSSLILLFIYWPPLCAGLLCCNFFYMLTPVPYHHLIDKHLTACKICLLYVRLYKCTMCKAPLDWCALSSWLIIMSIDMDDKAPCHPTIYDNSRQDTLPRQKLN